MRGVDLDDALELGRLMVLPGVGELWEPEPFQVATLDALCRGVDVVWLEIPEGNSKTTSSAAFGLIHLFMVEDADVPVAAASRDQTGVLLRQAMRIATRSPELEGVFRAFEGYRRITCPGSGGRLQVFAADAGTGDGVIPTLAILEELHRHPSLELFRTWRGKLWKRRGQILIISTAGEPGGEYENTKAAALEECARLGEVRREPGLTVATMPGFEMRIHAIGPDEDVEDLEAVKRANPLSTITVETLAAKRADPTWNRQHWSRFTCGRATRDSDSAITEAEWIALPKGEIPEGTTVDVGADFAWKHDTTALVPFWVPLEPLRLTPELAAAALAAKAAPPKFIPSNRRVVGVPEIIEPPRDGTSLEPSLVRDAFIRIHTRTPIRRVAMDPAAGGAELTEWLEREPGEMEDPRDPTKTVPDYGPGFGLGVEVVEVSQGNVVQCRVYDAWMEAIREGWLEHPHDEALTRHVLNAIAKPVSHDRYRFDRPNPSRAKKLQDRRVIDALVAASGVHWQVTAGLNEKPRKIDPADYRVSFI